MRPRPQNSLASQVLRLRTLAVLLVVAVFVPGVGAHSLFLKLKTFFLAPETSVSIALVNGTFDRSDNVIDRDRMLDVSLVGPSDEVTHPPLSQWREEDNTTWLDLRTGAPGTYVAAVSTKHRVFDQTAEAFNRYLQHDGVLDVLEARERDGELERPAKESYAKHVKAVFQVGEERSGAFDTVLGYPVEIVPLRNPYDVASGDTLPVRVLKEGQPLANQLVYANHAGFHGHTEDGGHVEAFTGRTDAAGEVEIPLDSAGIWYVRLIHMTTPEEPELDYWSEWATLTFEVPAPGSSPLGAPTWLPVAGLAAVLAVGGVLLAKSKQRLAA